MKIIARMRSVEYAVEMTETFTIRHSRRTTARTCENCGHRNGVSSATDQIGNVEDQIKERETDEDEKT